MVKIHNKSVEDFCKSYRGEKFMALFCDAPYSLGDGTKGFMNKEWDNDVACNPETWRALAEHLLPGAFLFVFAGTLNDDLISVAMRQAGLRKFHKMINWAFGSGFPKATRIDTAIDRASGVKQKIVGKRDGTYADIRRDKETGIAELHGGIATQKPRIESFIKEPATPLARAWAGHRYGSQALKPAAETILIFQKPYQVKPVDCITKTGAGALWVDGGRIASGDKVGASGRWGFKESAGWNANSVSSRTQDTYEHTQGRWPANLILHHRPECNGECVEGCAVAALDRQSGVLTSGTRTGGDTYKLGRFEGQKGARGLKVGGTCEASSGGASRFFFRVSEQIDAADPIYYTAKASRRERDAGLEGMPERSKAVQYGDGLNSDTKVRTVEQEENGVNRGQCRNHHPTVKPIALARYLATLLLPPAEYAPRRILIPFAGVASEAIGAMLAGWEEVVAVEKEKEYCDIGKARAKYWEKHREPKIKPTRKADPREEMLQHSLF